MTICTPTAVTVEGATLVFTITEPPGELRVPPGVPVRCNGMPMTPPSNAAGWFQTLLGMCDHKRLVGENPDTVPIPEIAVTYDDAGAVTGVRLDQRLDRK